MASQGAGVTFHLSRSVELGSQVKGDLSRPRGDCAYLHLQSLLQKRTAGRCFSGVTKVLDQRNSKYQVNARTTAGDVYTCLQRLNDVLKQDWAHLLPIVCVIVFTQLTASKLLKKIRFKGTKLCLLSRTEHFPKILCNMISVT